MPATSPTAKVLIVDDQQAVQRIISRILQNEGYDLYTANNGAEALQLAQEIMPDVVLLDVLMPNGLSGFEVCKQLRANHLLNDVPILMVTALDDRESRLEGIQNGADDFIVKPFDPLELQARVRNITRLNRYRRLLVERLKFEWVVEESDEGYLIINDTDDIVYANSRAQLYLNLPPVASSESHGRFSTLIKEQYNAEPVDAWKNWPHAFSSDDQVMRYLIRPESNKNSAFWLQVTALHLSLGMQTLHIVRLRDITNQMSSNNVVWQLHSMILHKLRTPFSSVLMSLELMKDFQSVEVSKEEKMLYATAVQQAQRLHETIDSMENLFRSPNDNVTHPADYFSLNDMTPLVDKLCQTLEITSYTVDIAPDLADLCIQLTEQSLTAVLLEVLRNAKKFHPQQLPNIQIQLGKNDTTDHLKLSIIDDGINLTPDQLLSVWQPYYQAEKTFTGEIPGTGLGLTAVATVIWQIGGKYQIKNRSDSPGVIVEFSIPIVQTPS